MYLGVSLTSLVLLGASGNQVQAKVFAKLSMDLNCYELGKQWNVEKENCMTGEAAQAVAFTKIKNTGPFCLTAYSDYACKGSATTNQYEITGNDNIAKVCRPIENRGKSYSAKKGAC